MRIFSGDIMTEDCIFCKIIKGEVPANIVYQDEDMVAFHNIKPSAPIHVLMIPVLHIESVNALEEKNGQVISKMMIKAKEIAQLLGIRQSGYKLIINVEKGAGQEIFHLHIHLIGGWEEQKPVLNDIKNNAVKPYDSWPSVISFLFLIFDPNNVITERSI